MPSKPKQYSNKGANFVSKKTCVLNFCIISVLYDSECWKISSQLKKNYSKYINGVLKKDAEDVRNSEI